MQVLLLEDEPAIRSALTRAMRRWGHEVVVSSSLAEARAKAAEHPVQCLVSDLKLPDGSGLEVARDLGLPFVLMSGMAAFDDAVTALRLGCVDFFTKPVPMQDLQQAIARMAAAEQARGGLELVEPTDAGLQVVSLGAAGAQVQSLGAGSVHWADQTEAASRFADTEALAADCRQRQLCAELMQAVTAGRVVINRSGGSWRAWLAGAVDWQAAGGADRRQVIEHLADRVVFQDDGVLVECYDA